MPLIKYAVVIFFSIVSLDDYDVYNVFTNYGVSLAITPILLALTIWALCGFLTCTLLIFR